MESFGLKTPVSCLQEYLISKKMIPHYELIRDGTGTHTPEFTYRVKVGNYAEEGTGRSKQEAKHRAAGKMLASLKIVYEDAVKEAKNEFEQELFENYVGQLKDVCHTLHYPEPKYYVEEEGGPPHSKIFKMVCHVSHLKEFGIYRTKKQAKQQAAFKMIQHLKEVGGKKIEEALANPESPIRNLKKSTATTSDSEVIEKYQAIKSLNSSPPHVDNSAFYKDHYKAYIDIQENSPTLTKILNDFSLVKVETALSLLQEVTKELGVSLTRVNVPAKDKHDFTEYTLITVSIIPPLGEVGSSENEAAFNLLTTLQCLCSKM